MSMSGPAKNNAPRWSDARAKLKPRWDKLAQFLAARIAKESENGRPKYKVLQDSLAEAIRSGVIGDNELLPTENELTGITPFSLGTVQRALKNLVEVGLIVRKAGVGTIVAPWRRELENPLHTRFLNDAGEALPIYTDVLSRRRINGQGPAEEFLHAGSSMLIIKRRMIIERPDEDGGRFCYYNHFYVDASKYAVFQDTPKRDLNGANFKRMMSEQFNLAITRVSNYMSVSHCTTEIATALGIDIATPLMKQRVYAYSDHGPLYYQEYWLPPETQEIVIDTALDSLTDI